MDHVSIVSIFCYPIKGLSPQALSEVELTKGAYFPNDRLYAIENGPSGFDETAPRYRPKTKYLMLMRDERLATLKTRFDPSMSRLTIELDGRLRCDADLSTFAGRNAVETFFAAFCKDDLKGPPRLLGPFDPFRFTDSTKGFVSFVNLASVAAIAKAAGQAVDPLRFRANLYLDGLPAWAEHDLIGRQITIGKTRLAITNTTERCAATSVDPATGERDINVVKTLVNTVGHNLCGVYARVVQGGGIRPGDPVTILD
ncbi:MOSC domain-containing protein [Lichenihabitans psoromatis]|uniref:MOSC domain-containing protein n=1 Tax=Lichenihabitans psoromatis TaxID=2528642 RepID=UPI0010358BFF|nr:MOSC domain-containing protein [Lichenihabitans psoromatis]